MTNTTSYLIAGLDPSVADSLRAGGGVGKSDLPAPMAVQSARLG